MQIKRNESFYPGGAPEKPGPYLRIKEPNNDTLFNA